MRRVPGSTYRLQLHREFTFDDAAAIVEYLKIAGGDACVLLAVSAGGAGQHARV